MRTLLDFYLRNVPFKVSLITTAAFLGLLNYLDERVLYALDMLSFKEMVINYTAPTFWFLILNIFNLLSVHIYNVSLYPKLQKKKIIKRFINSNVEELALISMFYNDDSGFFQSTQLLPMNNSSVILLSNALLIYRTSNIIGANVDNIQSCTFGLNRYLQNYLNGNKVEVLSNFFKGLI